MDYKKYRVIEAENKKVQSHHNLIRLYTVFLLLLITLQEPVQFSCYLFQDIQALFRYYRF